MTPIRGDGGARAPFFSHDSQSVAYFTADALWKVSLRGGPPQRIGGTPPVARGGAWLADGSIVVAPTQTSGLARFSPDGHASPLTTLDAARGEIGHLWPHCLPNGDDVLFTIRRGHHDRHGRVRYRPAPRRDRRAPHRVQGGAFGQYSPTGHLVFVRGGTLSAIPFDLARNE